MLMQWPAQPRHATRSHGFTLIELLIAMALFGILMFLAFPAMQEWMNNAKVRTTADTVQNGLRQTKAEAIRRSRITAFFLTDDTAFANVGQNAPADLVQTANAAAKHWGIFTASSHGKNAEFIEAGLQNDANTRVRISGPSAICFNSLGRLVERDDLKIGNVKCAASSIPATYDIAMPDYETRDLRITVSAGGSIRMCDPAKKDTIDAC